MAKQKTLDTKQRFEADTAAALSVAESERRYTDAEIEERGKLWRAAREDADREIAELKDSIETLREESRATGILQKINYDQAHNELLKYAVLYQIKRKKSYLKGGMTWEDFCDSLGESRRNVNRILDDLSPLYDALTDKLSVLAGVTFNKIRYLGKSLCEKTDNLSVFDDGTIIIDGTAIPLSPENKDDIEAAIDALKESQKRQADDHEAKLKAKDRVLEEKERVIHRQEKDLAKFKREVKARGYEPGEENFIRDMENLKTLLVGIELKMDWRNVPKDPTPLMRAAYIETIGHAARVFRAYYDEAVDLFGDPEMDDDWQFPDSKEDNSGTSLADYGKSCTTCEYHKGMSNPKKGVKIPGRFGKCTRPGGHCNPDKKDDES